MTKLEKSLTFTLELIDVFTSPTAKDYYAGAAAIIGLAIVAELILAIF